MGVVEPHLGKGLGGENGENLVLHIVSGKVGLDSVAFAGRRINLDERTSAQRSEETGLSLHSKNAGRFKLRWAASQTQF